MFHLYDHWAQMMCQIHAVIKQYEVIITLPFILDKVNMQAIQVFRCISQRYAAATKSKSGHLSL